MPDRPRWSAPGTAESHLSAQCALNSADLRLGLARLLTLTPATRFLSVDAHSVGMILKSVMVTVAPFKMSGTTSATELCIGQCVMGMSRSWSMAACTVGSGGSRPGRGKYMKFTVLLLVRPVSCHAVISDDDVNGGAKTCSMYCMARSKRRLLYFWFRCMGT